MTEEHKQYPPEAIANTILWLAQKEGRPVTPMKLIKLVYVVYERGHHNTYGQHNRQYH